MLFSVGKSWHVFCLFVLRLMPVPLGQFELFFATIWQLFGFNFCNICISEPCTTKLHTIPTLCPLCRPQPSLLKHLFFTRNHDSENMSCLPNLGSFCLVFSPPRNYKPHCTHPYALVLICTHSWPFWSASTNIMSGEISPAIAPKSCPGRPKIPSPCLVFVLFVWYMPQCTHPHPPAPIYTRLHPFTR